MCSPVDAAAAAAAAGLKYAMLWAVDGKEKRGREPKADDKDDGGRGVPDEDAVETEDGEFMAEDGAGGGEGCDDLSREGEVLP